MTTTPRNLNVAPKRLLTIRPDGSIQTLETKKGLDVKKLGPASVVRSSLIEWVESEQAWRVRLLHGEFKGLVNNNTTYLFMNGSADGYYYPALSWWKRALSRINDAFAPALMRLRQRQIPLWKSYDDAVAAEIEIIQNIRRAGYTA